MAEGTRSGQEAVPYNTGAQMAAAIGVSEMTLIRFLRSLGYANLRDMKDQLRPSPAMDTAPLDDVAVRFTSRSSDVGSLAKSLELELAPVHRAYELAAAGWERAAGHARWGSSRTVGSEGATEASEAAAWPPPAT